MVDDQADLAALTGLSRRQLHARAAHYYKLGGLTEPEVALVRYGQATAVFKDYARTPGWFGRLIAPMLIWREASALRQLDGVCGIPRLYRQLDRKGVLIEYLSATPWPDATPPAEAYSRLSELVAAMHRRGVAHGDLRSPSNLLVSDSGQPYIVDFIARVRRGRFWNLPWNWIYRQFEAADESAMVKLRVRFAPRLAAAGDRERLDHQTFIERAARTIGYGTRDLVRLLVSRGR